MENKKNNCSFQYYDGVILVISKDSITLEEAKELWNEYYDNMVENVRLGLNIEVAIWVDMIDNTDYSKHLIYLSSPEELNGVLYEPLFYTKF